MWSVQTDNSSKGGDRAVAQSQQPPLRHMRHPPRDGAPRCVWFLIQLVFILHDFLAREDVVSLDDLRGLDDDYIKECAGELGLPPRLRVNK